MKFRRDRRSAHTAAFRSQAVPPQRPVAGRRCLNLVQPRRLCPEHSTRYGDVTACPAASGRITAAAHPKVSPGRNPNPARSHHLRPRNARSARSSSPSSRPSSSWRSSSAELPHSSSFTARRTRPRPVQTSDTTDATPKKTQKQSPTQIEGKKAVSEVTMTNFVCNYDISDWGGTAAQWFPT